MIKNCKFLIFVIFLLICFNLFSQKSTFSVAAGYGINKLISDLNSKPAGSGGMAFFYSPVNNLETGFSFNLGTFSGTDKSYVYNNITGVQFLTNFYEVGLKVKYDLYSLIDPNPYAKFSFYLTTGLGFINFSDRLEDLNGNFLAGFGYKGDGDLKAKATTETFVPIGLGFKYRIDKNYSFSFEPVFNWCNTDKLDFIIDKKKDSYLFFPIVFEYKIYTKRLAN